MLTKLVNELAFEFSVLVKDSIGKRGSCLISALVKQAANNRGKQVICVNTEPAEFLSSEYKLTDVTSINVLGRYQEILNLVLDAAVGPDCCIVFTSLSLLLMNYSQSEFSRLLRHLRDSDKVSSVVALIHIDVLAHEETLPLTEYLFDAVINVLPTESELNAVYYGHAKCLCRRTNGKVESSDEYFSLKDGELDLIHASTSATIKSLTDNCSVDIMSALTFNLSLSDREREAKNKLQLPYLKKDTEKQALLSQTNSSGAPQVKIGDSQPASSSGGKIYYHYDEADDFDEEDPDDDLDI